MWRIRERGDKDMMGFASLNPSYKAVSPVRVIRRMGFAMRLGKNLLLVGDGAEYDSLHDDSPLQDRCQPGATEPSAAAD